MRVEPGDPGLVENALEEGSGSMLDTAGRLIDQG
jgi:hypothetical protein